VPRQKEIDAGLTIKKKRTGESLFNVDLFKEHWGVNRRNILLGGRKGGALKVQAANNLWGAQTKPKKKVLWKKVPLRRRFGVVPPWLGGLWCQRGNRRENIDELKGGRGRRASFATSSVRELRSVWWRTRSVVLSNPDFAHWKKRKID